MHVQKLWTYMPNKLSKRTSDATKTAVVWEETDKLLPLLCPSLILQSCISISQSVQSRLSCFIERQKDSTMSKLFSLMGHRYGHFRWKLHRHVVRYSKYCTSRSSLRNNDLSARTSQKPMNKYPPFICYLLSLVIYSSLHPIDAKTPSKNISKESRLKAILW